MNSRIRRPLVGFVASLFLLASACSKDPAVEKKQRFDAAEALAAAEEMPEAILEYKAALQLDPVFGQAHRRLGDAYAKTANYPGALQEYIRAADLLPDDEDTQLLAGQYLLLAGQFEQSKSRALHVLERQPKSSGALLLLGNAWAGLRNFDESVQALQRAVDADPNRAMSHASVGAVEAVRGRRVEAEAAYARAIEVDPSSVNARVAFGNYYMSAKDVSKAEEQFLAAARLEPANPVAAKALASLYLSNNNPAAAEPYLLRLADQSKDVASGFALADVYVGTGRQDEALKRLTAMAAVPATLVAAKTRLAALEFALKHKEAAYAHVDDLLKVQPESAPTRALRGRFLLADNRLDEATKELQASVVADAKYVPGHFWLAQALIRQRRGAEARVELTTALQLEPTYVPAQVELSRQHIVEGEFDKALDFAQQAAQAAPTDTEARLALARALLGVRQLDRSAAELAPLQKALPSDDRVRVLAAQLNLARRNPKAAEASFAEVLKSSPGAYDALDGLLTSRLAAGDVASAVAGAAAAAQRTPDDPRALIIAARTYAQARDLTNAEELLRRAIDLDPGLFDAYSLLGQVYLAQNRSADALREFDTLAKLQPTAIGPRTVSAVLHHAAGRRAEAKKAYEAVLNLDPNAVVAANNLAWMTVEDGGNLDVALQLAQTAKTRAPDAPAVSDTLGWIYYHKALYPSAIVALTECVKAQPKNATYQYHLGMAYSKSGDLAKGRQYLEAALTLNPSLPEATEVRALLAQER